MPPVHSPSVYIVVDERPDARELLQVTVARLPVRAVLLKQRDGQPMDEAWAQSLCAIGQAAGAAVLVENDIGIAERIKADGVHLASGSDLAGSYREARRVLGKQHIVGAEAGGSRHLAMELGEAGADYISFAGAGTDETQLDLVSWWAELFEVPCVALDVADATAGAELIKAGADFLGVSLTRDVEERLAALVKSTSPGHPGTERTR